MMHNYLHRNGLKKTNLIIRMTGMSYIKSDMHVTA